MIFAQFRVALRSMLHRPVHTLINGLGLAAALACCLLLGLFVEHQMSYDAFVPEAEQVVRVTSRDSAAGFTHRAKVSALVGPRLEESVAAVEQTVRLDRPETVTVRPQRRTLLESQFFFADPSVFDVFGYPLVQGDRKTPLDAPDAIVLSESAAETYFGNENPIGKTLPVTGVDTFRVTAVMQDVPSNAHLRPNVIASFAQREPIETFYDASAWTYAQLQKGVSEETFEASLTAFEADKGWEQPGLIGYAAQPLLSIHLNSDLFEEAEQNGSPWLVWTLLAAMTLIVVVASVNFVASSIARTIDRAPQVGIRKALGAQRHQVLVQFFLDTGIVVGGAAVMGALAVPFLLPAFESVVGASLSLADLTEPRFLGVVAAMLVVLALTTAGAPAWVLSRVNPSTILRRETLPVRTSRVQQGLVAMQFAAAGLLLAGTVVIDAQVEHLLSADVGFDTEQVIAVPMEGPLRQQQQAFVTELSQQPGIASVSRASGSPFSPQIGSFEAQGRSLELHNLLVDANYAETMGLTVVAGRDFDPDRPGDMFQRVMINQATADLMGWDEPVGNLFQRTGAGWDRGQSFEVIGVVDNVRTESLRATAKPVVFQIMPPFFSTFLVRAEAGRFDEALASAEGTWAAIAPDRAFQFTALDQQVQSMYEQEQRLADLTTLFGALALLLAFLGVYGMVSYAVQREEKEMAIRKVLGATVAEVMARLVRRVLFPVGIGLTLAVPIAWVGGAQWLRQFASTTALPVVSFTVLLLGVLMLAATVAATKTVHAARQDPTAVLRAE